MDKLESRKDDKSPQMPCSSKCRSASERQKLEDEVNTLLKVIREKEVCLKERLFVNDANQKLLKDIRQEKDATIKKRRAIDEDLNALNNEKTRETFLKLRGSLQYRTEDALNEAIRRLEQQLVRHNYKVTEEIKIVQEIDRLKRSRKSLKEYLALEKELEKMKENQRLMRSQRDAVYRRVTTLRLHEDDILKKLAESRSQIDQLKKDLELLHSQRRTGQSELKQVCKELHQKRQHSLRKRDHGNLPLKCSPRDDAAQEFKYYCKKDRSDCKSGEGPWWDDEGLCNTLTAYLQRLIVSSTTSPTTPSIEQVSIPAEEIQVGDRVLVLKKRDDDEEFGGQRCMRTQKRQKKEKKRMQNRLLSHAPETLDQFFKLGISPPSSLNDVPSVLETLEAKKLHLVSVACGVASVDVLVTKDDSEDKDGIAKPDSGVVDVPMNCRTAGSVSDSDTGIENSNRIADGNCDTCTSKDYLTEESAASSSLHSTDFALANEPVAPEMIVTLASDFGPGYGIEGLNAIGGVQSPLVSKGLSLETLEDTSVQKYDGVREGSNNGHPENAYLQNGIGGDDGVEQLFPDSTLLMGGDSRTRDDHSSDIWYGMDPCCRNKVTNFKLDDVLKSMQQNRTEELYNGQIEQSSFLA